MFKYHSPPFTTNSTHFDSQPSFIVIVSILFLTANSIAATIQSRNDPSMVAFIASNYVFLMLFFWCMRVFDRLPHGSLKREWIKVSIWSLAMVLNVLFTYQVTVIKSSTMAWLVWAMAGSSCLFTFYFFFIYRGVPTLPEATGSWSGDSEPSFIVIVCILFLTANTIAAAIRSRDDPLMVSFVLSIYVFLMLFFWCVRVFNQLPNGLMKRKWFMDLMWSLGTVLNVMFTYHVTVITSSTMAWLPWPMAGSSCLFTFYFFIYRGVPTLPEANGRWSGDSELSFIVIVSILFLTANTIAAAIRSCHDPSMVAFIASIYVFLMLFFWSVRVFNRLPYGSQKREWLKVLIWSLATVLNVMFAYHVTVITSNTMAWLPWAMVGSSCPFTFYFFFIYRGAPTLPEANGRWSGDVLHHHCEPSFPS